MSHVSEPKSSDIEKISQKLVKKGFSEVEVQEALEIVITYLKSARSPALSRNKKNLPSVRLLSDSELPFFTREAHGFLVELQTLRLLTPLHVEQIIDRALMMGLPRINLDDMKFIVAQILIGRETEAFNTDAVYHPGNDRVN